MASDAYSKTYKHMTRKKIMKYELLTHAFYIANHIPTIKDMMKLHWNYNMLDITAKPPTRACFGNNSESEILT